jgi:hypothetical protein
MKFNVRYSYNFDLVNSINVLTGEPVYVDWQKGIFELFGETLSEHSKGNLREAVELNGRPMLGPLLSLVMSAVPNFEKRSVVRMFSDPDLLQDNFKHYSYYEAETWAQNTSIFGLLVPVLQDLEMNGFRHYWIKERLPRIKQMQRQLNSFASKFNLGHEVGSMLGMAQALESITVYLCTFAAPHGIKVCGPRYITDVVFSKETSIGIAIHEMFHPPYNAKNLAIELQSLGCDRLLEYSFEKNNPRFGYPTMEGFIEENVVEAMAIFLCHKLGLEKDPLAYFAKHDGGTHMLSVVLFEYFSRYPKSGDQTFEEYFRELFKVLPVGSLDKEYEAIRHK